MSGFRRQTVLTGSPLDSALARWTQAGFVKSVQRGVITLSGVTSNTATITAVDPSNARLVKINQMAVAGTDAQACILLTFTNGTTITATVITNPGGNNPAVSFEVIEYFPGVIKSVQRGTITTAGALSNTATITPVITLKTMVDYLGMTSANAANNAQSQTDLVLTNATTLTANCGSVSVGTQVTGFQVVEWF